MAKVRQETKVASKSADMRSMTDDQIDARIIEVAKEQLNLRFQKASGQLEDNPKTGKKNTKVGSVLRKEVARLKTEKSTRRNVKTV